MYPEGKRFQNRGYASSGLPLITVGGLPLFPHNNRSTRVKTYPDFRVRVPEFVTRSREFFLGNKRLSENWSIWEVPKEETRLRKHSEKSSRKLSEVEATKCYGGYIMLAYEVRPELNQRGSASKLPVNYEYCIMLAYEVRLKLNQRGRSASKLPVNGYLDPRPSSIPPRE
jgi:hypothetical protein